MAGGLLKLFSTTTGRNKVLGSGAFGIVYHGFVARNNEQREVAVKTLKVGSAAKELRNLLSEIGRASCRERV